MTRFSMNEKLCYLVSRKADWPNGWINVASFAEKRRAKAYAATFGDDAERQPNATVQTLPFIDWDCEDYE